MSVLRRYNPSHFVLDGQTLSLTDAILGVFAGSSFTTALAVTIAAAASPGVNVLETLTARRSTAPGTGFGAALKFRLDDSANVIQDAAQITAIWTNAAPGTQAAALGFSTVDAGGALTERLRLTSSGQLFVGTGAASVASAKLQVDSTTQGVLDSRMTNTQRNAISSPAEGLRIWNLTTHTSDSFDGTSWSAAGNVVYTSATGEVLFGAPSAIGLPGIGLRYNMGIYGFTEAGSVRALLSWDLSTATGNVLILGNITASTSVKYRTATRAATGGHKWYSGSSTSVAEIDDVRQISRVPVIVYIGASPTDPDACAALEINSTTSGLLQSRWSTTQRNAIGSPVEGLLGYDTTAHRTMERRNSAWNKVGDNSLLVGESGQSTDYAGATAVTDLETIAGNVIASATKTLHFVDCTADRTVTLPAAASIGHLHIFVDYLRQAAVHPTTFNVESSGTVDGNSTAVISDPKYARTFLKVSSSAWLMFG